MILGKNGELRIKCRKLQIRRYLINRHVQWITLQSQGKAKLRRMLLRTGQKKWILGCSLRGHQSRNTTNRNSPCSEQVTTIKGPTPVADKNLVASSRSTRRQDRTRKDGDTNVRRRVAANAQTTGTGVHKHE